MRLAALGCVLSALGCATGLGSPGAIATVESAKPKAVSISNFRYDPAELSVTIGDTVVWMNDDALLHTASADSGAWSSPEMRQGERFTYVALRAGRFPYHCTAHPVMRATLIVRP